ncbi:MAG: aminoacyl-tRNA deacylase [Thermoanaerobaculia bacterium]
MTAAMRVLLASGVAFTPHLYKYVERGGTGTAAAALGVPEFHILKTLVMEAQQDSGKKTPLIVVMHGDHEVSTKQLARHLKVKAVAPASEAAVERITGYVPGGVSPFGTRTKLPTHLEETASLLDEIYVNGGKRGFLVSLAPADLQKLTSAILVTVGIKS